MFEVTVTIFELFSSRRFPQVSLRKQEIADRLNAWIIFNEKNKELCEWLTQMENKVSHNTDLSIEEMVEKLKKVGGRAEQTYTNQLEYLNYFIRKMYNILYSGI